jgi:hypothetical protein
MIAEIARWALAFGFLGIVTSMIIQFNVLSSTEKKKYGPYLVVAIIFTGAATIVQMALLGVSS